MRFKSFTLQDAKDHILTAFFLVIAVALMVSRNEGGIRVLRSVSITVMSYIEEPLANVRVYREALKTNEDLRRQNILLMDEVSRLRSMKKQNETLKKMLGYRDTTKLDLLPVMVVTKDLTGINNIITINAGKRDSVKVGMPLVTPQGLVGRVILTSDHYSEVMPFFNRLIKISGKIQGDGAYGIVSWNGHSDNLDMDFVPQTIHIDSGMIVETSGYGNQLPPNIPIGSVIHTKPDVGRETQEITLKPFVTLSTLSEAFLVRYQPDTTITRLHNIVGEQY
ncbi:MAG TPA: rod shape-determining protein MreC [Balneolales bacterium]|nr:rod shape-determining protein MreC [Balneolales bacterium]